MDLLARPRRALRRLLGLPAADWAGPDRASEESRRAGPIAADNRHEVVSFEEAERICEPDPRLTRLARDGHRVFRVSSRGGAANGGGGDALHEREPRLFDLRLRGREDFESLDRLRRDAGLGATVSLVPERSWLPLTERLRDERGWPTLELPA